VHLASGRASTFLLVAAIGAGLALGSSLACSASGGVAAPDAAGRTTLDDVAEVGPSDGRAPRDLEVDAAAGPVAPDRPDTPVVLAPFHIVGRVDRRDAAGPRFGWSGIELRARFSGPSLALVLRDTGTSHYDVSLDGAAPSLLVVSGGQHTYDVASGLAPGVHELVFTKRTETVTGVTQLLGFVGALVPSPAPSGRRMELVGDSITCGFGVLGADETCPFSASTESEPLAWGALAAKQLSALHMVTAVSGLGVVRNYGGDSVDTMPERYDRALANDAASTWDHHAFEPDVIIVALGTNDFSGGKGDPGPGFEAAYTSFLAILRAKHPAARIVATTSPMLSDGNHVMQRAYVAAAVATRTSAGDLLVSMLDLDEQSASDGYGCGYHPSLATQAKMAAKLVAHVKPLTGW
jgi:lysophospholipase L1-like esterase